MNPVEVTLAVLKAKDEVIRPIEYWKTHCVNCGGIKHLPSDRERFCDAQPTKASHKERE